MNVRKLIVLGVALIAANTCGWAQTNTQVYSLAQGLLTDDCPICDRLPTVLPLTGTFKLSLLEETPLVRRYELTDIDFQAGSKSNRLYTVSGTGVYEVGGEVAVSQSMFLDVQVTPDGAGPTEALCANSDRTVSSVWPKLQIHVDQTNGTLAQVFRFDLLAAPAPVIRSCVAEAQTASLRLDWEATGDLYQLERATNLAGPFLAVTGVSTNSSFLDAGVLTNFPHLFYRLLKY